MKKYHATYQIEVKDLNGDIVTKNAKTVVKAISFSEARSIVKDKYKGKNIKVKEEV